MVMPNLVENNKKDNDLLTTVYGRLSLACLAVLAGSSNPTLKSNFLFKFVFFLGVVVSKVFSLRKRPKTLHEKSR